MSLLPAAKNVIAGLPANDPLRITLEEMISRGHIGRAHPIRHDDIVAAVNARIPVPITKTIWQTTVLKRSRTGDCFIGSGSHGYFIIDTIEDTITMRDFYESRIKSEQDHLTNLKNQVSAQCGWTI
jgi:hypothetical protein